MLTICFLGWALTFPNGTSLPCQWFFLHLSPDRPSNAAGWISAVRVLGDIFELRGFYTWNLIMSILMCAVWLVLFSFTVWAFIKGEIFMAKPEDVIQDSVDRKMLSPTASDRDSSGSGYHKEATGRV